MVRISSSVLLLFIDDEGEGFVWCATTDGYVHAQYLIGLGCSWTDAALINSPFLFVCSVCLSTLS